MSDLRRWLGIVFTASVVVLSNPLLAQEIVSVQAGVQDACPKSWEGLYSKIERVPGSDIWLSDLGDKARYVNSVSSYIFGNPYQDVTQSIIQVETYNEVNNIQACAAARFLYFDALQRDALLAMLFDHTAIRDTDGDGIFDAEDQCPNTSILDTADAQGCAPTQYDADDDGVDDTIDQCPDTPAGSQADPEGCIPEQRDTDGDGVNDALDQCADTTGIANANGCSLDQLDSDGDGITDLNDSYPHQSSTQCTP